MQFLDLKSKLKEFPIFSLLEIEKINPTFHKQRLSEWQKKGYIKKIRQGFYIFSDWKIHEQALFLIANIIYKPSYISLEMALSLYHLIPESVYGITSVSSRKTNHFKTEFGTFIYHHLKPELLFGYRLQIYGNHTIRIAEIEKTVLDYLYIHPHIKDQEDFEGMRFNSEEFKAKADIPKFKKYLNAFNNRALTARATSFLSYLEYA